MSSGSPTNLGHTPPPAGLRFSLALTVALLAGAAALWTGRDYWQGDGRIAASADLPFVDLTYAAWDAEAPGAVNFPRSLSWPAPLPLLQELGPTGKLTLTHTIRIPDSLRTQPQGDLAFDPLVLRADAWEFRVNGRVVASGSAAHHTPLRIPAAVIDGPDLVMSFELTAGRTFSPGFASGAQPFVSHFESADTIRRRYRDADSRAVSTLVTAYLAVALMLAAGSFFTPFYHDIITLAAAGLVEGLRLLAANDGIHPELSGSLWGWTLSNGFGLVQLFLLAQFLGYTLRLPRRYTTVVNRAAQVVLGAYAVITVVLGPDAMVIGAVQPGVRTANLVLMAIGAFLAFRTALHLHSKKLPRFRRNVCLWIGAFAALGVAAMTVQHVPQLQALQGSRMMLFVMVYWKLIFLVGAAVCLALEWARAIADRQKILGRFGLVVDRRILREVILRRDLPALRHEHTVVLAADMRNFTAHCETQEPAAVLYALNQYLDVITTAVHRHGGSIDKFMGDGVLALWGIPKASDNDEALAVRAALAIRDGLAELNAARVERGDFVIEAGIGVHAGRVIFGPIGNDERVDFTVIGPAVNIASRLEALTKKHAVDILISAEVLAKAGIVVPATLVGRERLRGTAEEMAIYTLDTQERTQSVA